VQHANCLSQCQANFAILIYQILRFRAPSQARQRLALTQYQQSIKTAFREVSDALVEYRKVKEIRARQESLVTTLQDRSRLAYLRYQGGVDTQLNAWTPIAICSPPS